MKQLVCIENPAMRVTAPDDMIIEVGGNCWQVKGPQPLTYVKSLWRLEKCGSSGKPNDHEGLDEAAEDYSNRFPESRDRLYAFHGFRDGAKWDRQQGVTLDGCVSAIGNRRWVDLDDDRLDEAMAEFHNDDKVIVQIRKK